MNKNIKGKEMLKSDIGGFMVVDEKGKEKLLPFKLPNYEEQPKEIYSNHVIINHTPTEFNLFFTRINPIITKNQIPKGHSAKLEVVARITLPAQIIPGFLKAFETIFNQFKEKNK